MLPVPSVLGQGHDGSPVQRLIARLFDGAAIAPRAVLEANGELDRTQLRLENCLLSLRDAPPISRDASNRYSERIVSVQTIAATQLDEGLDQYVTRWGEAVRALYPGIAPADTGLAYAYVFTPRELERLAAIPMFDTVARASAIVFDTVHEAPAHTFEPENDTVYTRL